MLPEGAKQQEVSWRTNIDASSNRSILKISSIYVNLSEPKVIAGSPGEYQSDYCQVGCRCVFADEILLQILVPMSHKSYFELEPPLLILYDSIHNTTAMYIRICGNIGNFYVLILRFPVFQLSGNCLGIESLWHVWGYLFCELLRPILAIGFGKYSLFVRAQSCTGRL